MSHTGLPDFPITPILTRRGVDSLRRNLSFKPPYASTPIHRPSDVSAENGERGKGKAAVVLRQQNEATGKPLKGQHQRSSEVVLDLQSKVLGIRNRPLGAKPAASGMKRLATDADTIQAAVQKLVMIGKTVSTSIDKTTATSKGDAQRKLGGQAGTKASLVAQSKGELKEKGCLELMLGSAKPWDSATTVASEPGKGAEKSVRRNENAPRLEETTKGTSSGRETTEREGSETSARRKENALRVDDTIQTKGNSRVRKGGKRAGKTGMRNENDPSLDDTIQNTDNHVGRFSKRNSVNNLQEVQLEPVHKVTRKVSESVGSMQVRTGHDNKADRKTLTIRVIASKGLPAKDSESSLGSIQVNSDSDQRTAKAVNSNQTEGKLLTRAPNPRSLKTKENNLKSQPMHIIKSAVALTTASANIVKTTARKSSLHVVNNSTAEKERASAVTQNSTNVVKTTAHESSGRVDNVIATEKEQPSVSALSNVQLPPGKSSAKNNPKVVTSQVSASQGVDSERLSSEVADSVVTNFDSGSSEGNDQETLTEPASVKTRAVKRLASAEISSDLEDSADASDSSLRQNNKRKKRKVVTESFTEHSKEELPSVSTQPERRFLKEKVSRPTKVLPNSSQEKVVKQAQQLSRRKSVSQRDTELKIKPRIYRRWKVASKPTVEFTMSALMQSFDEKFKTQKVDLVMLVKYFEELKTRIVSEVSLLKVPTSRQPVNYFALAMQEETLKNHLDESLMDVEEISQTISNCEGSTGKLKVLKEHLQSKRIATSEAERLYKMAHEMSQSAVESLGATEQSDISETQAQ